MKKKILTLFIAGALGMAMFTGCGSSKNADTVAADNYVSKAEVYSAADNVFDESEYYEIESEDVAFDYGDSLKDTAADTVGNNLKQVKKEMLVYRCQMSLDTTEFDGTLTNLRKKINEYNGFVEEEHLEDNSTGNGKYIMDSSEVQRYYKIVIRVPSANYQDFVSSAEGLGRLTSKNATVDDVSTRYGTLSSRLAIYEADYDRYLAQYEETKDEQVRLQLQDDIRELAITIADIKTEMSSIESDVAYSYVTIYINEYFELPEATPTPTPKPDPTFGERFKEHAKDSWDSFLEFCEDALYFVMDTWWGFVIFGLIVLAIYGIVRLIIKMVRKSNAKRQAKEEALKAKRIKEAEANAKAVKAASEKANEDKK